MKKNLLLVVTAILFVSTGSLFAQNHSKEETAKIVQKIFREKIHRIPADNAILKEFMGVKDNPSVEKKEPSENRVQSTEVVVSGVAEIESEMHAAINPVDSNNLVVSANAINPAATGNDIPINHIYYSNDFGSTWTKSAFDPLPQVSGVMIAGGGDPEFAYDLNGRVYTTWINLYLVGFSSVGFNMYWAYSDDGGITWQRDSVGLVQGATGPVTGLFDPTLLSGPIADKEGIAVDRTTSAYRNTLYCSYFEVGGPNNVQAIAVKAKRPADASFPDTSVHVTDNTFQFVQFSSIDVDNMGGVHVTFCGSMDTTNHVYALYHSVSNDGGATFSTPNKISDLQLQNYAAAQMNQTIAGIDVGRIYPSSYIAADQSTGYPTSGNLYFTWTANGVTSRLNNGADVYFSRSSDYGTTWSLPIVLNNTSPLDTTDQYYPCLNVSPQGRLVVDWYDRRNYTNINTDYYMAYSDDGGFTFNNDFVVTNAPTDFATVGSQNQNFGIGEYNAVVTTPAYAIPFWSDGRTNDGDMNIYCATVFLGNLNVGIHSISQVNGPLSLSNPYPNPATSTTDFVIHTNKPGDVSVSLFDNVGKKVCEVFKGNLEKDKTISLDLSHYAAGKYSIVLRNSSGMVVKELQVVK